MLVAKRSFTEVSAFQQQTVDFWKVRLKVKVRVGASAVRQTRDDSKQN